MRRYLPSVILMFLMLMACGKTTEAPIMENTVSAAPLRPAVAPPQVTTRPMSVSAKDFALPTVAALLKTNLPGGVAALQERINDPSSGINNIDSDGDGQVDYVKVKEQPRDKGVELTFLVYPSKVCSQGENSEECSTAVYPVASLNMSSQDNGAVSMVGAYPSYVDGHRDNYLSYTTPVVVHNHNNNLTNALLLYALLRPHPVYVAPLYTPTFYRAHTYPVLPPSQVVTTRTTYVKSVKVAPVPVKSQPSGYTPPPSVVKYEQKVASRYAAPTNTGSSSGSSTLKGAAAGVSSFGTSPSNRPAATGFGAPRPVTPPTPSVATPPVRPVTPSPAASGAKPWYNSASASKAPSAPSGALFGARPVVAPTSAPAPAPKPVGAPSRSWFQSSPASAPSRPSIFGGGSSAPSRPSSTGFGSSSRSSGFGSSSRPSSSGRR